MKFRFKYIDDPSIRIYQLQVSRNSDVMAIVFVYPNLLSFHFDGILRSKARISRSNFKQGFDVEVEITKILTKMLIWNNYR